MPPTDEDRLREWWVKALEQWESALNPTADGSVTPRSAQVKSKRWGWPFWPDIDIVLTGEEGAGKTVLARALMNRIDPSIDPLSLPLRSRKSEDYKFVQRTPDGRKKIQFTVIPGQASGPRRKTEDTEFGARPVKAVIHAVCWGRNKTWNYGNRLVTVEGMRAAHGPNVSLEEIFDEYKRRELDNFRRVGDLLRNAWQDQHDVWLIIAVTMCDLIKGRLGEARDYFIPTSAELRADTARAAAKVANNDAEAAEAEADAAAHVGSDELTRMAAELRAKAEQANEAADLAVRACTDEGKTGFARALEEFIGSINVRRFKGLAVLPVSSVHVQRSQFGIDAEEASLMDTGEINQLLDYFITKVGEFCSAEEDEVDGR